MPNDIQKNQIDIYLKALANEFKRITSRKVKAEIIIRNIDVSKDKPDFVIPAKVTAINQQTFMNTAATYIYIQDSADDVSIGAEAFAGCGNLMQIRIPANVKSIADNAIDNKKVVIIAARNSYAYQWAVRNGFTCRTE